MTARGVEHPGVATFSLGRLAQATRPGGVRWIGDALAEALEKADRDDDVRAIVLTGFDQAISPEVAAGADVKMTPLAWYLLYEDQENDLSVIRSVHKPIIAAVDGPCYGASLVIAANADIVVASEAARFGFPRVEEVVAGIEILPFIIGVQWSKYLTLSGRTIDAATAADIGLVVASVPTTTFGDEVLALATRIAAMPREGVLMNKRTLDGALQMMGLASSGLAARAATAIAASTLESGDRA